VTARRILANILRASTRKFCGDPEIHPQPEAYWCGVNPIGSRSCYDEGKRCADAQFFYFWRQHQHPNQIKVVRIFNNYGPRMHPGASRAIYGNGSQTRSF
jgi:UDP-glucuronate decarboxylase